MSQYVTKSTEAHWSAVKRVFRYLQGTKDLGITYSKPKDCSKIQLECCTDASYGDNWDRKSTSGEIIILNGGPITWSSRKQKITAQSTVESEYIAMSDLAKQVSWLRQMLTELGKTPHLPITIFEDNEGTISLGENATLSRRSKHIDIRYHAIREQIEKKYIRVIHRETKNQYADIMTKGLPREQHEYLRSIINLKEITQMVQLSERVEMAIETNESEKGATLCNDRQPIILLL